MTPLFEDGRATPPLRTLLFLTGLTGAEHGGIKTIHEATQKMWRQPGKHSGDIEERHAGLLAQATPLFKELGVIGEQLATKNWYDYVGLCGAYILAIRKRFALLSRMWNNGLRFDHLELLASARKPHPEKESLAKINTADGGLKLRPEWRPLTEAPPTEAMIAVTVLEQSDLPEFWRHTSNFSVTERPLRVDRPEKPDPSGEDVLRYWLECAEPKAGSSILLIYSQPQLLHLQLTARRILEPAGLQVECAGYEAPGTVNVSQVLDTLAKVIHEMTLA